MLRYLAAFLLGLILGGTILNTVTGQHLDRLTIENQKLQSKLDQAHQELKGLQASLVSHQRRVITGVEIQVDFAEVEYLTYEKDSLRIALEKKIADLLEPIRGQSINDLDPLVISKIIDGRIVEAEHKRFDLYVKLLTLAEKVEVFVIATPHTAEKEKKGP